MFVTDETNNLIPLNPNNILWEAPPTGLMRHPVIYSIIFICGIAALWYLYIGERRRADINSMLRAQIRNILIFADSPIKRVGLIFIVLSILYLVIMATHWTVYHKNFIYKEWSHWMEKVQKPQDEKEGTWIDGNFGWTLYNNTCQKTHVANNRKLDNIIFYSPEYYDDCKIKFIWHTHKSNFEWRQSFDDFIANLFSNHFKVSTTFLILIILGFIMFFGMVDRSLRWIISGNAGK